MGFSEGNHQPAEAKKPCKRLTPIPIQPAYFVVLVIRIIIPVLRLKKFVPRCEHRDAIREEQEGKAVLGLRPRTALPSCSSLMASRCSQRGTNFFKRSTGIIMRITRT